MNVTWQRIFMIEEFVYLMPIQSSCENQLAFCMPMQIAVQWTIYLIKSPSLQQLSTERVVAFDDDDDDNLMQEWRLVPLDSMWINKINGIADEVVPTSDWWLPAHRF